MIELRPKGTSLPVLSATRSNTASRRVDLPASQNTTQVASNTTPASTGAAEIRPLPENEVPPPVLLPSKPPLTAIPVTTTPPRSSPSAAPAPSPTLRKETGIASPAKRGSGGDSSLVRVFGLKLGKVVIDAGHGGHDTGTIGPHGLLEKELVLDVALRLGKLITRQLGADVIYTRSDDTFIPLEERTKVANNEKADLFISIHANSSPELSATGVETYFFNFTSDRSSLDLATRENATSTSSISDLNDLLHRAVLKTKLEESREFAQQVQSSLWASSVKMNNKSRDRGVRQAPFVVLIGATMPSILAEIGFVSNPHDEKLLQRPDQRQKIAEALYKGISRYANSLSHLEMARATGSE
jgi:N-acetylmuramoyl-L-alanine amidase